MKKILMLVMIATSPILACAADVNINLGNVGIRAPGGVTVTFGSRDNRGYYWDGYEYRDPDYWHKHDGPRGERYYTGRGNKGGPHRDEGHCPPGQAKKGRC